jgi:O-antigen ligase
VVILGAPGLLLGIAWFILWIRRTTRTLRENQDAAATVALRWSTAMVLGFLTSIFFSAHQFLNEWFWLAAGFATSLACAPPASPVRTTPAEPPP